jgi:hypothetical protein
MLEETYDKSPGVYPTLKVEEALVACMRGRKKSKLGNALVTVVIPGRHTPVSLHESRLWKQSGDRQKFHQYFLTNYLRLRFGLLTRGCLGWLGPHEERWCLVDGRPQRHRKLAATLA